MFEENAEEVKVLEAQIKRLQAEVSVLERQQQETNKDQTLHLRGPMQYVLYVTTYNSVPQLSFPHDE